MIYLDYSANTPVDEVVLQRFCEVERTFSANPNAHHHAGAVAKAALDGAISSIQRSLGCPGTDLIFTSGASEANNQALKGLSALGSSKGRHILYSPLEHTSVTGALAALEQHGFLLEKLHLTAEGTVDLERLRSQLRPDTILLTVCAVDSELGTVQPIAQISELLRSFPHCRFHVDATQAAGKIPLYFEGIDTISLTAHKFYGLNGVGLLLKRKYLPLEPLIHGGSSTTPYRSGTPAVALACSMAVALEKAVASQSQWYPAVQQHNARLRSALSAYPKVRINSPASAIPHILNLSVQGVKGTIFQRELDAHGVCVSVKSACSSDGLPSQAVLAVSGDRRNALSSWRISLSHLTTEQELDEFLSIFDACYHKLVQD